jgi:SAM-dependent methyltransferase
MHDTSKISGELFLKTYCKENYKILEIGGSTFNGGSFRYYCEKLNIKYMSIDIEKNEGIDYVINPGDKYPFEPESFDIVISSSCFEHDPCFWITFKEMCRITKLNGYIYVSAPSNGAYHKYPGDNWRFYSDAGQSLSYWSGIKYNNDNIYPVKVEETFHIYPKADVWIDFICIWKRILENEKETTILVNNEISNKNGILKNELLNYGLNIKNKIEL